MNRLSFFLSVLLCLTIACGDDDGSSPADATPDSALMDASSPDGAAADSAPTDGAAMDAASPDGSAPDAARTDADTPDGSAGGAGAACGSRGLSPCADGFYCDFSRNDCGATDRPGQCATRPDACAEIYQPACGCDGMVYSNACEAAAAGQDVNDGGGCTAPERTFSCGSAFCSLMPTTLQYCQREVSDVGSMPDTYTCLSAPRTCSRLPLCRCLSGVPCGDMCMVSAEGGQIVTCPGG
jgi:hypothetical protein